jgi:hypothetical protein
MAFGNQLERPAVTIYNRGKRFGMAGLKCHHLQTSQSIQIVAYIQTFYSATLIVEVTRLACVCMLFDHLSWRILGCEQNSTCLMRPRMSNAAPKHTFFRIS